MVEDKKLSETADRPDPSKFESIDLALTELRRRYDDEERRRVAIEDKSNRLLALDAVLIPLITGFSSLDNLLVTSAVILLLISGIMILIGVRGRKYARPLSEIGHVYAYADDSNSEFAAAFAQLYKEAIIHNESKNNQKYRFFNLSFSLTGLAVLLEIITIIQCL